MPIEDYRNIEFGIERPDFDGGELRFELVEQ